MEKIEPCALLVGMQNGAAAVENILAFPLKLNIGLSYDPTIALLDIYPRVLKVRL